jgi:hypothetical protein
MIGPQLLAYWARDDPRRRDEELARFARLEFGEDSVQWVASRSRSRSAHRPSLRGLFRRRKAPSPAPPIPVGGATVPTEMTRLHPVQCQATQEL